MICPHCGKEIEKLNVTAPATVETLQEVEAIVEVGELAAPATKTDRFGKRFVQTFTFDGHLSVLDNRVDHRDLELDDPSRSFFYCGECNGEINRELFEKLVAFAAEKVSLPS